MQGKTAWKDRPGHVLLLFYLHLGMGVQNCLEKAWRAVNIMAAVWDVKRRALCLKLDLVNIRVQLLLSTSLECIIDRNSTLYFRVSSFHFSVVLCSRPVTVSVTIQCDNVSCFEFLPH